MVWYAYFRFYVDETTITDGLNEYCTQWEHMYEVGYNYKEYKCFVDNLGGFMHWVGDMRGYALDHREIGFIDGSPSDGLFDQTLLMGTTRVIGEQVKMLAGFGKDAICYVRKITAKDAGTDHAVNVKVDSSQKVKHPVMYTLDTTRIEMFKITGEIIDNSDVDEYEFMVDVNKDYITTTPSIHSNVGVTVANPENMMDIDVDTYCRMSGTAGAVDTDVIIFDMGKECNSFGVYGHSHRIASDPYTRVRVYISNDLVSWTLVIDSPAGTDQDYSAGVPDEAYRYVKFDFYSAVTYPYQCDVFMLIGR